MGALEMAQRRPMTRLFFRTANLKIRGLSVCVGAAGRRGSSPPGAPKSDSKRSKRRERVGGRRA